MSTPVSTWAIRNPIPPIVLFLVLTVAGLVAFSKLEINNSPSIVVPIVSVTISQPGASPSELQNQVTRRVEGAIAGVRGVKHISSTISEGASVSTIEFQLETDYDRAMSDTRDAVANIRDQLPRSILEPNIQRMEIDGGAVLTYSVEAPEMRSEELSWYIDDKLSRELLAIRGVASVQRKGGNNHEITVILDPSRLAAYGVSAADINRQLAQTNIDLPGGRLTNGNAEFSLRTLGNAKTVDALRETWITLGGGQSAKLGDLADIRDGGAEQRTLTRLDGKPAITFAVFRSKGSSEVTVGEKVEKKLAEIGQANPQIAFKKIFSLAEFTKTSFNSTLYTFIEGTVLTILVVFIFLRDRRATVLAAITIPLSVIPTFLVIYFLGFTLNFISMMAISLVTGVLVDDAIVEIENIHRHMKEGRKPYDAAMIASSEIGLAVVATTLVICAVFMPVSFMDGIVGKYFVQFGATVSIAAFFSLVVARLLTPMLAAYFLKSPGDHEDEQSAWIGRYQRLVEWTLNNRRKTLVIAGLSMVLSFSMLPFLSTGFVPYEDYSQSSLTLELPRGSTLKQTDEVAQVIQAILKKQPEVEYVLTSISGGAQAMGATSASGVNLANIDIKLVPIKKRSVSQKEFENRVLPQLQEIPDVRVKFANSAGAKDISIALVSDDSAELRRIASVIESEMRTIQGISGVGTSANSEQPEIVIIPDFAKAASLGISVQTLSDAINIATIGDIDANLAKFNYGSRQIPIRVRLASGSRTSLETVRNLQIPARDSSVPLSAIAEIRSSMGPTTIERYDRQEKIALEANLNGLSLGAALEKINALPLMKDLPASVQVQSTGDAEVMAELFSSFLIAIGSGLMIVYSIQVLLYKDWIQPFTRMAALPLSIGGAFLALLLAGAELNMSSAIGILMLMGIADKNSILLVDYMLEKIHHGVPRREAILEATIVRARPIIMTSLAMLAGMVPIALGLGADTAFRAPMAVAVIGGLISSTALSLIFVPVLFDYVRDFEDWMLPKLKKLV